MLPGFPKPLFGKSGLQLVGMSSAAATGTSVTCNVPAGVQNGDLLVAIHLVNSTGIPAAVSGWTNVFQSANASFTNNISIKSRVASSEPASYTFTENVSAQNKVTILAFRGASAVGAVGTITRTSAKTITAASMTAAGSGLLFAMFAVTSNADPAILTPPSGMTLATLSAGNTNESKYAIYSQPSSAGTTGTRSLTWDLATNSNLMGILFEVVP